MRRPKHFLPMLALAGAMVVPAAAYADPAIAGSQKTPVYVTDVSAQRVVRRPVTARVAMVAPSWSCQSIACRNYLIVGVSH